MSRTKESRTHNSILNIMSHSLLSFVSLGISFLNRIIFLSILDATYLGVSGLFSNILLVFSLVELGMGAALTQMFYKPFSTKDYEQLSKVTYTTKCFLNIVGVVIIVLTILFTPYLSFFVNDINAVPHMRLIFFLYGINSGATYFWGYYRTIITANQQAYKLVKIDIGWKVVVFVMQSIILYVTRNFICYLLVQIILNIILNYIIKIYVQNQLKEIDYTCKKMIEKRELKDLAKNIAGLSMNRIAMVVTNGTDNIIISKYLDLLTVGLASNYIMIQQAVTGVIESFFSPLLASVGNLCASESEEKKFEFFKRFTFASFWIYGFCSIMMCVMADIFVEFVLGSEYIISPIATFLISFDVFLVGLYRVASLFRTAQGLFWYGKFRPLIQAIINLCSSLILVKMTHELWAVYAGTVLSRVLITVWYEPYIVMKYGMKRTVGKYYFRLCSYVMTYLVGIGILVYILDVIQIMGLGRLVLAGIVCGVCINVLFWMVFGHTNEFKYWLDFVRSFLQKIRIKR